MQVVDFRPEHVREIDLRAFDRLVTDLYEEDLAEACERYARQGPVKTGITEDGQVVAIVGIWPQPGREGYGMAWALTSPLIRRFPKSVHKAVRDWFPRFVAEHGFRVVETLVHRHHYRGQEWVKRLGFRYRGIILGPDGLSSYFLYYKEL